MMRPECPCWGVHNLHLYGGERVRLKRPRCLRDKRDVMLRQRRASWQPACVRKEAQLAERKKCCRGRNSFSPLERGPMEQVQLKGIAVRGRSQATANEACLTAGGEAAEKVPADIVSRGRVAG